MTKKNSCGCHTATRSMIDICVSRLELQGVCSVTTAPPPRNDFLVAHEIAGIYIFWLVSNIDNLTKCWHDVHEELNTSCRNSR